MFNNVDGPHWILPRFAWSQSGLFGAVSQPVTRFLWIFGLEFVPSLPARIQVIQNSPKLRTSGYKFFAATAL